MYQTSFSENSNASATVSTGIVSQCFHHNGVYFLYVCLFEWV